MHNMFRVAHLAMWTFVTICFSVSVANACSSAFSRTVTFDLKNAREWLEITSSKREEPRSYDLDPSWKSFSVDTMMELLNALRKDSGNTWMLIRMPDGEYRIASDEVAAEKLPVRHQDGRQALTHFATAFPSQKLRNRVGKDFKVIGITSALEGISYKGQNAREILNPAVRLDFIDPTEDVRVVRYDGEVLWWMTNSKSGEFTRFDIQLPGKKNGDRTIVIAENRGYEIQTTADLVERIEISKDDRSLIAALRRPEGLTKKIKLKFAGTENTVWEIESLDHLVYFMRTQLPTTRGLVNFLYALSDHRSDAFPEASIVNFGKYLESDARGRGPIQLRFYPYKFGWSESPEPIIMTGSFKNQKFTMGMEMPPEVGESAGRTLRFEFEYTDPSRNR